MTSFYALIYLVFGAFNNIILWFLIYFFVLLYVISKIKQVPQRRAKIGKEAACDRLVGQHDRASSCCRSSTLAAASDGQPSRSRRPVARLNGQSLCADGPPYSSLFRLFLRPTFFLFIALSWDILGARIRDE